MCCTKKKEKKRKCAVWQEKPLPWEAFRLQPESSPTVLNHTQWLGPSAAKNKLIKFLKICVVTDYSLIFYLRFHFSLNCSHTLRLIRPDFFQTIFHYKLLQNIESCSVLYCRSLLFKCCIYSSVYLLIPYSNLFLPLPFPSGNCMFLFFIREPVSVLYRFICIIF